MLAYIKKTDIQQLIMPFVYTEGGRFFLYTMHKSGVKFRVTLVQKYDARNPGEAMALMTAVANILDWEQWDSSNVELSVVEAALVTFKRSRGAAFGSRSSQATNG